MDFLLISGVLVDNDGFFVIVGKDCRELVGGGLTVIGNTGG